MYNVVITMPIAGPVQLKDALNYVMDSVGVDPVGIAFAYTETLRTLSHWQSTPWLLTYKRGEMYTAFDILVNENDVSTIAEYFNYSLDDFEKRANAEYRDV